MAEVEIPKQHKACVYDDPGNVSIKVETVRHQTYSRFDKHLIVCRLIHPSLGQVTDRLVEIR